jgi:hypothetical protein
VNKDWLEFVETADTGKTKVWAVHNKDYGDILGTVSWSGPWRQYCFYPQANCVWNASCLEQLTTFVNHRMAERNAARDARRGS